MFTSHPIEKISERDLPKFFVLLLIAMLAINILFGVWGQVLVHEGAPLGIISFEFVWNLAGLSQVMGPWDETARQAALGINLVDFVYMATYGTTFAAAAILIQRKALKLGLGKLAQIAVAVAWFAWIATGFDVIENLASLPLLLGHPNMPWPLIMSVAAALKFILLFEVLVFIVFITVFLVVIAKKTPEN